MKILPDVGRVRGQGTKAVSGGRRHRGVLAHYSWGWTCTVVLLPQPCIPAAFLSLLLQPPVYSVSYWMDSLPIHALSAYVDQIRALLFVTKGPV